MEQLPFSTNMNQELQQHQANFKESEEKYGEKRYKRDLFIVPFQLIWKSTEKLKKVQEKLVFWVTLLGIPALFLFLQNHFSQKQQPLSEFVKQYALHFSIVSISIFALSYLFLIFYVFLNMGNIENKDCLRIAIFKKRNKLMYDFHKNYDSINAASTQPSSEGSQQIIQSIEAQNAFLLQRVETLSKEVEEQEEDFAIIGKVLARMIKNFRKAKNNDLDYVDLDIFDLPFTLYCYENKTFERIIDYRTEKAFPKSFQLESQWKGKFQFVKILKKNVAFYQFGNECVFKFKMEDGSIWILTYYEKPSKKFLSTFEENKGNIYNDIPELLQEHLDYIRKK